MNPPPYIIVTAGGIDGLQDKVCAAMRAYDSNTKYTPVGGPFTVDFVFKAFGTEEPPCLKTMERHRFAQAMVKVGVTPLND
jgi:hypothetical protein